MKNSYDVSKRHANALSRFTSKIGGECFNDLYFVSVEQGNDPRAQVNEDNKTNYPVGFIDVMLMKCNSRGSVEIKSLDPSISPDVNENMLDDELDRKRMRYGVRKLVELFQSSAIENIVGATSTVTDGDGKSRKEGLMIELGRGNDGLGLTIEQVLSMNDNALDEWMVKTLSDGIHICSSCKFLYCNPINLNNTILTCKYFS